MTSQPRALAALQQLSGFHAELADVLASVTAVVAEEAVQNAGFRDRLSEALIAHGTSAAPASNPVPAQARPRKNRRAPGPWDPYVVYADVGEAGLRERLAELELAQLQNIVAEHGMNNDGLAMRWKKADKVIGRIVERVVDRASKGDAFRSA